MTLTCEFEQIVAPIHLIATRKGPLDCWRGGRWGMNHPVAHTPLESLFLLQSLLTYGVDNGAFVRISDLLRNNVLIKSGDTYDPTRLSPDALQQQFLSLLRDESRSKAEHVDEDDGSGPPGSRKRKLESPPLPTLKGVYENVEKVPILVDRLYARYRDNMVKLIREDERKFALVQKDIQLLERAEKERLARAAASQNSAPTLAPRDPKVAAAGPNGPSSSQRSTLGTPSIRRGPTPNLPILPPKPPAPTPTMVAPKAELSSHHQPAVTPPLRPAASPKPPNGAPSVLQAPVGAPKPTGPRDLQQPPAQPRKQAISPRLEPVVPDHPNTSGTPQVASPAAGALKWEKPYQPPQSTQSPQVEQFLPTLPLNNTVQQKPQQQPQWPQKQQQQAQYASHPQGQTAHPQQSQARSTSTKSVLVPPQSAGHPVPPLQPGPPRPIGAAAPPQSRPPTTASPITPGRLIQPQQSQHQKAPPIPPLPGQQTPHTQQIQRFSQAPQSQLAQKFQQVPKMQQTPRAIASASPGLAKGTAGPFAGSPISAKRTPGPAAPQRWQQNLPPHQGKPASPSASSAPLASLKDKPYSSPYVVQASRLAIPEHMIRQAAITPGPVRRLSPASLVPRTPGPSSPVSLKRGFGTKWASHSTPSTPGPTAAEPQSPAYEPVSPPWLTAVSKTPTTKSVPTLQAPKSVSKGDVTPVVKTSRGRPARAIQRGRGASSTPSIAGTRRSQSVASQTDELSLDHSIIATKVKKEVATPRLREETGDTTADESYYGRGHMVTPSSISRVVKRKRQDNPAELQGPLTHVLWTRGFTKVSSSALDQISSHRDANMFATALREKDAPNYRQIVLQPQDITSIRSAIKAGNKSALQAAASLPDGDPGTASVWLPISDDLVPPKGIINSAHLERELVHMFCNAIMYNPDPNRGPGPAFLKRSQDDEEEVVGYRLDENGVVKNTQSMFLEVEKLLGDLRAAEKDRGIPPISTTRQDSVVTPADDTAEDEDELAGEGDTASVPGTVKRRRISTRV